MRTSVHLTKPDARVLLASADPDRVPARERDKLFMVMGRMWSGLNGTRNGGDQTPLKKKPRSK